MNSRVFIMYEGPHDYTPAGEHGQIVFLTNRELSPVSGSLRNVEVLNEIRRKLADYIPGIDYICPTGSPTLIAAVSMILAEKAKSHNILHWSNQMKRYTPTVITV